jgi:hypothetical protein
VEIGVQMINQYRLMKIKQVVDNGTHLALTFEDHPATFHYSKKQLLERGIKEVEPGDRLFLKGRNGNDDENLRATHPILDIRKYC